MKTRILKAFGLIVLLLGIANSNYAQNWNEIVKTVASDRAVNDRYGRSVAIDGNYAVIRNSDGKLYIYELNHNGTWVEVQKISPNTNMNRAVSVDISGDLILIGSEVNGTNETGGSFLSNAGSAYIYQRNSTGVWSEVQKLVASDRSVNARFGHKVEMSGDKAIISANRESMDQSGSNQMIDAGAAYVFTKDPSGVWTEEQKLVASDREAYANFGCDVSISNNHLIIGADAERKDELGLNIMQEAGAAYVFERNVSGVWNEVSKIVASNRSTYHSFGEVVSIEGDKGVIGVPNGKYDENGNNSVSGAGEAYVIQKTGLGWVITQKLVASNRQSNARFGVSTSMSNGQILIGAKEDNKDELELNHLPKAGAAFFYEKDHTGSWNIVQKIVASDRGIESKFGESVAISGNSILIGAPINRYDVQGANYLNEAGAAYFFENDPCASFNSTTSKSTQVCDQDVKVFVTATPSGGTTPYFYNWSNGADTETFSTTSNGTYDVTITDNNGCTITDQVIVDDTDFRNIDLKLIREDCGRTGLDPLDAQLNYQTVTIADAYRYRINGGSMVDLIKDSGNDDNFNLNQTPGFEVNTSYTIEIAARINGLWTAFGMPCTVVTQTPSEIRLKLLAADCGREGADPTNTRLFFERRIDATAYQVKIENTTLGYSHTLTESAGSNSVNLGHYPNIEYNTTYDVSVSAEVDGVWSTGGAVCQVTTADINSRVNLTLRDEYCGKTNLDPDNARLDFWKRWGANDPDHQVMLNGPGVNHQVISRGTQGVFNLRHFSGVQFDATYTVKIRAHVDGNTWSAWGDICEVKTASMNEVVNAKLDCYSCGQTNLNPSSSTADIYFVRRHDATDHKVYINGPGVNNLEILVGTSGAFPISQITGMQYNATYIVKVAALIDNVWSAYGDVCTLSTKADPSLSPPPPVSGARVKNSGTAATNQVQSAVDQTANPILVYPNPVQQGDLNLQFSPLSTAPIQIEVCDILGKTVYSKSFSNNGQEDQLFKIAIGSQIPNGIYTITVLDGNQELHTKVVVE